MKKRKWKDLYVVAGDTGLLIVGSFCYSKQGAIERCCNAFLHGPTEGIWKKIYRLGYRVVRVNLEEARHD